MPDTSTMEMSLLLEAARKASGLLRVLANENRLMLMCQLSQGERAVGELESLLGIRQPTLSQQLGILREEGLVATRRVGKQIFYRINDPQTLQILQTLYDLYCPVSSLVPADEK